ncbi:hypothetical protein AB0B28_08120 [Glycomyces sp. NPDC046736]|uniref:hypothetical protein n=1 Tax=Glycomyces sp. NPDC046736 TaxID=3155615 RepID=UPI0033C2FF25
MALNEGQVRLTRPNGTELVLGRGTPYRLNTFNPLRRGVRVSGEGDAPWGDGGWAAAEWRTPTRVPFRISIAGEDAAGYMNLHWPLDAAFAPIRDDTTEAELAWVTGGVEYAMYGRPRGLATEFERTRTGQQWADAEFYCPDPTIYSGPEQSSEIGLYRLTGGLSVPFTVPFGIYSVVADGEVEVLNAGTAPARLLFQLTGPVVSPYITVTVGGISRTLYLDLTLGDDEWLDIDTRTQEVILNSSVSRLSSAYALGPWPYLPAGQAATIQYRAASLTGSRLTIRYRNTH